MPSSTVRISRTAQTILRKLAAWRKEPLQAVLDHAIEEYRRKCFLEETNAAFAALKKNRKAWKEERKERFDWDRTLSDGLKDGS